MQFSSLPRLPPFLKFSPPLRKLNPRQLAGLNALTHGGGGYLNIFAGYSWLFPDVLCYDKLHTGFSDCCPRKPVPDVRPHAEYDGRSLPHASDHSVCIPGTCNRRAAISVLFSSATWQMYNQIFLSYLSYFS